MVCIRLKLPRQPVAPAQQQRHHGIACSGDEEKDHFRMLRCVSPAVHIQQRRRHCMYHCFQPPRPPMAPGQQQRRNRVAWPGD